MKIANIAGADGLRPYLSKRAGPTWAFKSVLLSASPAQVDQSYHWRRAVRALEDFGLLSIKLGPRRGLATATLTWTPRAYFTPTVRTVLTSRRGNVLRRTRGVRRQHLSGNRVFSPNIP
jgi:hypothetical protein